MSRVTALSVTTAQAAICAEFILDQENDGEYNAMLGALSEAVMGYEREIAGGMSSQSIASAVEDVREQIERWLMVDPEACVGLLGPGLGIEQ